ncbi:MAG: aminotransferase class III-fold pyridoxal phosphate-dependent enzyme [Christensenellaceae bacterium]|jgi:glutamate-1-semialdehyde 2,1-aminomutase|nr:aminotransferase class III-fold pyridoxal phosphate-dependent enzyme [Christensenellaceae bacterium]
MAIEKTAKKETYKYIQSQKTMERASKVVPCGVYGHLGPAEGCMIPTSAYPFFLSRAKGSEMWDADGNRFIDYMCGYGPNVLGYCDPEVDEAANKQMTLGNCTTLPNTIMVDFAELLTDTVRKDWAFFAKNGGDVTQLSIMVARAHTGKKKIIFVNGYYHGVAPWTQKPDSPGVLPEDCRNSIYVNFNDLDQLTKVISEQKDKIACFIATPYMHGNFKDNVLPEDGYWAGVRKLCTENNIVLIIDDIRAGFRLNLHGSDAHYGFEADLICFCKAIANGYNVSALCGKNFLKPSVSSIMYTGSYWMSAVPFAAGLVNIKKLIDADACTYFKKMGTRLTDGLTKIAATKKVNLSISGEPAMFYLMIKDDNSLLLHQEWIAECVKRGVFITNHHNHFINLSLTEELVDETLVICDEAMDVMVKNHPEVYN